MEGCPCSLFHRFFHPRPGWRILLPALTLAGSALLSACDSDDSGPQSPPPERGSAVARVVTTYGLSGAEVEVEPIAAGRRYIPVMLDTDDDGLVEIPLFEGVDAVRIVARGGQVDGEAFDGELSAYLPAAVLDGRALYVNAVTTLVDRVRSSGALPLDQAEARVSAFLQLDVGRSSQTYFGIYGDFSTVRFFGAVVDEGGFEVLAEKIMPMTISSQTFLERRRSGSMARINRKRTLCSAFQALPFPPALISSSRATSRPANARSGGRAPTADRSGNRFT